MGSKKNVVMSSTEDTVKIVADSDAVETPAAETVDGVETTETTPKAAKKPKQTHLRSKKYHSVRAQVDKTKTYDPFAAVELVKKLSYSKFEGTLTADVVVREAGQSVTLTFPHSTGKTIRVAVASDAVIEQIEAGNIDFDMLVTSPQFMPKLAKLARVLGPKGLMPNPKNGTISENPAAKKKELEGGQTTVKTEKKAPLMHVTLGKTSMETKELVENLQALIEALNTKAVKMSISATMSPSVKVTLI